MTARCMGQEIQPLAFQIFVRYACFTMEMKLRYRGREVTDDDITFIEELIAKNPGASRRALSKLLCEAWDWRQANGELRDMVCRSLMLKLHRAGLIELPPVRQVPLNNVVIRRRPQRVLIDRTPWRMSLKQLRPLEVLQVRRTQEEAPHPLGEAPAQPESLARLVDQVQRALPPQPPQRHPRRRRAVPVGLGRQVATKRLDRALADP